MLNVLRSIYNYPFVFNKIKDSKFHNEHLYTENSIKSYKSIKTKSNRKDAIYDYLRFTIEVPNIKDYVYICKHYKSNLDPFKVTNHWEKRNKAYNGYHIYANTCTNFPYEVQIHTTKSLYWRDNKLSHTLYESSKYALDHNKVVLYVICQCLIFWISSELIFESLYINFMFQLSNSFL